MKSKSELPQGVRYASVIGATLGAFPLLGKQRVTKAERAKAFAWLYKDTNGLLASMEKAKTPQQPTEAMRQPAPPA